MSDMKLIDFIKPMKRTDSSLNDVEIRQCNYYEYLNLAQNSDYIGFLSSNFDVTANTIQKYLSNNEIRTLIDNIISYSTNDTPLDVLERFLKEQPNKEVKSIYYMIGCENISFYDKPLMMFLLDNRANYLINLENKRRK